MTDVKIVQYVTALQRATSGTTQKETENIITKFVSLVRARGHQTLLPRMLTALRKLESHAKTSVHIRSAKALTKKELEQLITDQSISTTWSEDPALLAGVVIEGDGYRLDASVSGRIQQVAHLLTQTKQ